MRQSRLASLLTYTVLVCATLIALFPVFWTATTSIKQPVDTFANPPKLSIEGFFISPRTVGLVCSGATFSRPPTW